MSQIKPQINHLKSPITAAAAVIAISLENESQSFNEPPPSLYCRISEKWACFRVHDRAQESRVTDDGDHSCSFWSCRHRHIIDDQRSVHHLETRIELTNLDSPATEIVTYSHRCRIARLFPSQENLVILIVNNDHGGVGDDDDEGPSWSELFAGWCCDLRSPGRMLDRHTWVRKERDA